MERTRTTLLLLLVVGLSATISLGAAAPTAATAAPAPTVSTPAVAVAAETSCSSCLKCPCGCSPLAGAWVAKLSSGASKTSSWMEEAILQTFKFAPVNDGCTKFVVNSQAATRPPQVAKFWPDACDQTEFVGIACKDEWKDMKLTAISYGVERCIVPRDGKVVVATPDANTPKCPTTKDKVAFIAIMTARIEIPESCLECDETGKYNPYPKSSDKDDKSSTTDDKYTGACLEPKELKATIYVSYFDAAQDVDQDGFPDGKCEEAVLCVAYETCLKRVELMEPCDESKSFVACLAPCREDGKEVDTSATGRAFFRIIEAEQKICFVVTVKDIRDVQKATLQIGGTDVVTLFPFPPDTKSRDGACDGLLSCGCFYVKDCLGSWRSKKVADIVKAIEEGRAAVVVCTKDRDKGEISGTVEDP